ncbi:zinc ribbon domain-containing protein [Myceligenerans crystallogenes]|uniref:C4-type zinc ribbon domain-containing protein n=1 Tax=Myceligenerans crystallogenes TaxID=316335 RepID=A0ABN2NFM7_9MICO
MPTAPPDDQRKLLEVQALDTRLQQLAHSRRNHPALARIQELEGQIKDLNGSLVESRTAVADLRRELTKAETDVEQVRSRSARDQQRLDTGSVGAKDAVALTDEIASLATRQAVLEEVELDVMERLEAHEEALAKVTAAHDTLVADRDAAIADRDTAWAGLDADAKNVTAERAVLAGELDAGLVAMYERIRAHSGGMAAAPLREGRCEGCRLELPPGDLAAARAAAPEQVVTCEECGRILVRNA